MEVIIQEDPDFIFVITMGDSEKALQNLKEGIETNPAWKDLSAVKNNRYIVLPKELFHYKPNARWGESYEYVAKILYPDKFE
jgi:iron complex transport system substrate-binding protein